MEARMDELQFQTNELVSCIKGYLFCDIITDMHPNAAHRQQKSEK